MAISSAPRNISEVAIASAATVHRNLSVPVLYEHAVKRNEGKLLDGGTFAVYSGARTGRSPNDKFLVKTADISEHVWWGQHNQPMTPETFDRVSARILRHLSGKELYVQDCTVSQDPEHRRKVRVISEQAYHSIFARTMFIPSEPFEDGDVDLTILHAPSLELDPERDGVNSDAVVALNLTEGVIAIAGTAYAGEMKKSVFTIMNYYLRSRACSRSTLRRT
jgi:phosphoenolpyruvate carboxykinase (ATP)